MRSVGIIAAMILSVSVASAGENHTISGEVFFKNDGDIYICLFTLEKLADFNEHPLSRPECTAIKMNSESDNTGRAAFKLDSVPKETYTIMAFQDVNNNKKVDYENYIINEPWSSYKPTDPGFPNIAWEQIKFDLNEDITGIKIEL